MGWLSKKVLKIQEILLCASRNWWRPTMTWAATIAVVVNAILIPVYNLEVVSLTDLAILFGALSPFFITRAVEKHMEKKEDKPDDTVTINIDQ